MKGIMKAVPFTVRVNATDIGDNQWKKTGDTTYECSAYQLKTEVSLESFSDTGTLRQINTITNCGTEAVMLTGFSSASITVERGLIAVDRNRWQSEGQWQFFTAEQCGLVPATIHPWEKETYVISSVGSWSTGVFYPLTMVIADEVTYYMELEGAHNWMLTHAVSGSLRDTAYSLEGTSAHEENGGWYYLLLPGESYTAQPALFGCVAGGFEEAAGELVRCKRALSLTSYKDGVIPVVFNDYMNCLWGEPSIEKLLPLIDAAASVGCEYFCIDAGWHKNLGGAGGNAGDWVIDESKFGEGGLKSVFAYMREKGLIPGVWFELDTVHPNALSYHLDDNCLLKRYGQTITRAFFNFKNEKVRNHLHSRIDELYAMGVRYIKNDYNQSTGIGCDNDGASPAEGLIENYHAFSEFIDEVRAAHPDLLIENCGSGACRAENGTLRHFHLQSTSDQEFYFWNPSVIIGSMPHFAPEKAGIWSYPCPLCYDEHENFKGGAEWLARYADGEETIFNMVNGMCGVLYQSGRLDYADDDNLALVREGIEAYKKMRTDIVSSHPIIPEGTLLIGENRTIAAGLETADKTRAYLAVWRIGTVEEDVTVDLSKYGYTKATAWYPSKTDCSLDNGILTIKLPKEYAARMVLLEK